jgi:hypothetical protein
MSRNASKIREGNLNEVRKGRRMHAERRSEEGACGSPGR